MYRCLLPTLSELLARSEQNWAKDAALESKQPDPTENEGQQLAKTKNRATWQGVKATKEWMGAIAALENLLQQIVASSDAVNQDGSKAPLGLVLTAPSPVLSDPALNERFLTRIFTPQHNITAWTPFQLPPAQTEARSPKSDYNNSLPLLPGDPLAAEQFCLVLNHNFSLVMVVGEDPTERPTFRFSFDPQVVQQALTALRYRMIITCPHQVSHLDALVEQFTPKVPDYRVVMQFGCLLLKYLPPESMVHGVWSMEEKNNGQFPHASASDVAPNQSQNPKADDVELLQAFAHEVRTPLTTIRTLTRLLLKRKDLSPEVVKRLEFIDHECTEQIDRMELLFQAAELETSEDQTSPVHLAPMSLDEVIHESLPRWQKQANRRNLTLDVVMPQEMPPVVSDPAMLDRVLTGLIENFTRNLPAGSHIQVQVVPAGNQLKVQLQSHIDGVEDAAIADTRPPSKSLGQLLTFQPETGCLSLNLNVTKNLFQALGGKLIVRQRPQKGEVVTIFLPLEPKIWNV